MRRLVQLVSLAVFVTTVIFGLSAPVQAQAVLTQDQEQRIVATCASLKGTLTQLHASDALLRVNRGQVYESTASKLMERFNARLSSNQLDGKAMETITAKYRSELDAFRKDYIAYEQKLSEAMNIDCTTSPIRFANTLEAARELRNKVHAHVVELHASIDDYGRALNDFLLNYQRISE
ncbi:hypothetical protein LRY29_02225 [Candidatus Saccharibacteria bacterium]|nr:hypothetical protein [Candidatus Saccharibacteria bacterium]